MSVSRWERNAFYSFVKPRFSKKPVFRFPFNENYENLLSVYLIESLFTPSRINGGNYAEHTHTHRAHKITATILAYSARFVANCVRKRPIRFYNDETRIYYIPTYTAKSEVLSANEGQYLFAVCEFISVYVHMASWCMRIHAGVRERFTYILFHCFNIVRARARA